MTVLPFTNSAGKHPVTFRMLRRDGITPQKIAWRLLG